MSGRSVEQKVGIWIKKNWENQKCEKCLLEIQICTDGKVRALKFYPLWIPCETTQIISNDSRQKVLDYQFSYAGDCNSNEKMVFWTIYISAENSALRGYW